MGHLITEKIQLKFKAKFLVIYSKREKWAAIARSREKSICLIQANCLGSLEHFWAKMQGFFHLVGFRKWSWIKRSKKVSPLNVAKSLSSDWSRSFHEKDSSDSIVLRSSKMALVKRCVLKPWQQKWLFSQPSGFSKYFVPLYWNIGRTLLFVAEPSVELPISYTSQTELLWKLGFWLLSIIVLQIIPRSVSEYPVREVLLFVSPCTVRLQHNSIQSRFESRECMRNDKLASESRLIECDLPCIFNKNALLLSFMKVKCL